MHRAVTQRKIRGYIADIEELVEDDNIPRPIKDVAVLLRLALLGRMQELEDELTEEYGK